MYQKTNFSKKTKIIITLFVASTLVLGFALFKITSKNNANSIVKKNQQTALAKEKQSQIPYQLTPNYTELISLFPNNSNSKPLQTETSKNLVCITKCYEQMLEIGDSRLFQDPSLSMEINNNKLPNNELFSRIINQISDQHYKSYHQKFLTSSPQIFLYSPSRVDITSFEIKASIIDPEYYMINKLSGLEQRCESIYTIDPSKSPRFSLKQNITKDGPPC